MSMATPQETSKSTPMAVQMPITTSLLQIIHFPSKSVVTLIIHPVRLFSLIHPFNVFQIAQARFVALMAAMEPVVTIVSIISIRFVRTTERCAIAIPIALIDSVAQTAAMEHVELLVWPTKLVSMEAVLTL